MEKFKIAIWVDRELSPVSGGAYSYPAELLAAINAFEFDPSLEIIFTGFLENPSFNKEYLTLQDETHFIARKYTNLMHKFFNKRLTAAERYEQKNQVKNIELLRDAGVQLIFYPVNYVHYNDFPYIVNNWDLGHASTYSFPEMTNTIDARELYTKVFRTALFICTESEAGKQELIFHLNLLDKKVKVLPFFPGGVARKELKEIQPDFINKNDQYFFYPAAFGAHKNHYGLVKAFETFSKKYPKVKLVFTGGQYQNKDYIIEVTQEMGLSNRVIFADFQPAGAIKWLYKHSLGLIMPTFLGPTNMPLLEAQALGCRVACSDLTGHRELLGDYAVYFEPEKTSEIVAAMEHLYELAEESVKIVPSKYSVENSVAALNNIFMEAIPIRRTWKH